MYIRQYFENSGDQNLPVLDFSQANELFTCPFKGNIKYSLHKVYKDKAKSLQLGSLGHTCFAAIRLWWLYAKQHLDINFIKNKCNDLGIIDVTQYNDESDINALSMVCYNVIANSDYQDDPEDKKRTKENLSISIYEYIKEFVQIMKNEDVWVDGDKIGVEVPFKLVINDQFVFIGRIDGIHITKESKIVIPVENKTSSLINESWLAQWELSNQIQGYCVACENYTGVKCNTARIVGLQIPQGKNSPFYTSLIHKNEASIIDWLKWFEHCVSLKTKDVHSCIKNKSSCYNYFRMCEFAHICMSNSEEEKNSLIEELDDYVWNPIEENI